MCRAALFDFLIGQQARLWIEGVLLLNGAADVELCRSAGEMTDGKGSLPSSAGIDLAGRRESARIAARFSGGKSEYPAL